MVIFDLLEKLDAMDKNNDYLVTKFAGWHYVLRRINLETDEICNDFVDTENMLRIMLEGIYNEVQSCSEHKNAY